MVYPDHSLLANFFHGRVTRMILLGPEDSGSPPQIVFFFFFWGGIQWNTSLMIVTPVAISECHLLHDPGKHLENLHAGAPCILRSEKGSATKPTSQIVACRISPLMVQMICHPIISHIHQIPSVHQYPYPIFPFFHCHTLLFFPIEPARGAFQSGARSLTKSRSATAWERSTKMVNDSH